MKRLFLLIWIGLSCAAGIRAQERLDVYARRYLGQPYVERALEVIPERLVVDTASVDCMTLVEYCLARRIVDAKVQGAAAEKPASKGHGTSFADCVGMLRYRDYEPGQKLQYSDRLHYATEWVAQAEAKGWVKDLSGELGERTQRTINFMSSHTASYQQLAGNGQQAREDLRIIKDEVEPRLSARPFTYIPKAKIKEIEREIQDGDIIFFTTSTDGLDVSHMAIACIQPPQGPDPGTAARRMKVGFIHASQTAGKVVIDPMSIAEYAQSRRSITGIKVVRPL